MSEAGTVLSEGMRPQDMVVFIANRGEIAERLVGVCREMGVTAILGCADQDLDSLAARSVRKLGAEDGQSSIAPLRGTSPSGTYGNTGRVIASARAYGATYLHPGYGFLAEDAGAAYALREAGIRFIGPEPETMELVGGKEAARKLAQELGVPVLEGSELLRGTEHGIREAEKIGFPVMIKAEHAGGGYGNRVVNNRDELQAQYAQMAPLFKDMHLERYVPNARHIEIQILGNGEEVIALGERDCSPQRKFQKVIEESPAIILPAETREVITQDALKMARAIKYRSLGTFEFLYDPASGRYWFMEVNCRIQVEHPVTEERYGLNLPKLQLLVEQGKPMLVPPKARDNHVIEARLYAEKPEQDFVAASGKVKLLSIPQIKGVRVDQAYEEGDTIPSEFDTTIAKIIATGATREEAREKLAETLANLTVTGVSTNREFLLWLINTNEFRENTITTTFIEGAWAKHQRERFRGVQGFLEGGEFFVEPTPRRFVPEMFPQNLAYEKAGVLRDYASDREAMAETCAVKFGIYRDNATGIRQVLILWDAKTHAGSLGSEEGSAIAAAFELGHKEDLPVTMITTSPGATQQEGSLALTQMDYAIAVAKAKFPAKMFVNIFSGINFGGVTASIASAADIQIAVDNSLIGLTGTSMVKNMQGLKETDDLPAGAHGVNDHYDARNIDLIVQDLKEARARVLSLYSILGLTDPHLSPLNYDSRDFDPVGAGTRFDRPREQRFPARIGSLTKTAFRSARDKFRAGRVRQTQIDITPEQRLEIIQHPLRPTAADLLNPDLGIFEHVAPLSHKTTVDGIEQYPTIIGAFARLGGEPVLVLGHQSQRKRDRHHNLQKIYVPQGPNDFRWAQNKINIAERLGIPIILIGDTAGASAYLEDERGGISREIAAILERLHNVQVPVTSINIGQNGSGGGLTFIRPLDAAADAENALTLVSTIEVMTRIVLGKWPKNKAERALLLNQIKDGTPEERMRMGQIDEIIQEPRGGAHKDWVAFGKKVRSFLLNSKLRLGALTLEQLLDERYKRIMHAAQFATRSTTNTDHT